MPMADLHKVIRSKDRIIEILNYLMSKTIEDEGTRQYISQLQRSIRLLDRKMEEYRRREMA